MSDERRCEHCRYYAYEFTHDIDGRFSSKTVCALNHPLQPCADYEREVGADDERGEHE